MKNFFSKIGRFFWSWGFLKFVLAMIALVVLFYIEEDWRGAHAWAATKAKWEAKGESFDYAKFIPPPVPDEQNLAAIPLFKLEPTEGYNGKTYMGLATLNRATRDDLTSFEFPTLASWQKGELPDMDKIKKTLSADYALAFKDGAAPDDALAQFNAIYPFFTDFVDTARTRPAFRVNLDYAASPPSIRPLGPLTAPIKLSKILTLHGILSLEAHRPDLAMEDLKINYELMSGVKRDPSLVGGLVSIGLLAIGNGILYDGLAQHRWNDVQLGEIEQILKAQNFLADYQFAMRSEVVFAAGNTDYYEKLSDHPRNWFRLGDPDPLEVIASIPWPDGWWEINKSEMASFRFRTLATVDPDAHLVFPKAVLDFQGESDQARATWSSHVPWKILAMVSERPILGATIKYAQGQMWVDETRIACALERYRLVQGVYPSSLDALAPTYIDEVPHDIMSGQPYHYSLRADGTFLLYSVGWNQTDDGGKVVYETDSPTIIDYKQGDWVWPTPKTATEK